MGAGMAWHNMPNTIGAKFDKSDELERAGRRRCSFGILDSGRGIAGLNKAIVGSIAVIAEFR
jgi:hypothetical protein